MATHHAAAGAVVRIVALTMLLPGLRGQSWEGQDLAGLRRRIQEERGLDGDARLPAVRSFAQLRGLDAARAARELFLAERQEWLRLWLLQPTHGCSDHGIVGWLATELGKTKVDGAVRDAVAVALASTEVGCQVLLDRAAERSGEVAAAARRALGSAPAPTETLAADLYAARGEALLPALRALRFHPRQQQVLTWLQQHARDPVPELRAESLLQLAVLSPNDAAAAIAEWLEEPAPIPPGVAPALAIAALRALPTSRPELLARLFAGGGSVRRACWLVPERNKENWRKAAIDFVLSPGDPAARVGMLPLLEELGLRSQAVRCAAGLLAASEPRLVLAGIRFARDLLAANPALRAGVEAQLEHRDAAIRVAVMAALQSPRRSDPEWVAILMQRLDRDRQDVRVAALALLGELAHAPALPKTQAAQTEPDWRMRAAACAFCVAVPERSSVPLLIDAFAREHGRMASDVRGALRQLTACEFATHEQWRLWWESVHDSFELPASAHAPRSRGNPLPTASGGTAFFQIPVASERVVFALDVSGSMAQPFATGGKSKLDIAREALHRTLQGLEPEVAVDVVAFAGEANSCWGGLRQLDATSRAGVAAFVDDRVAGGATDLFGALMAAYVDPRVDTIYLLTDGEPTTGAVVDADELAELVRGWNLVRRVTIHAVAIGHRSALLRRLAMDSGGVYMEQR